MTDNAELLPCPFCGGEAEVIEADYGMYMTGYAVYCRKCCLKLGVTGRLGETYEWSPVFNTEAEAIAAWNARHQCGLTDEDYSILLDELGVSERTCKMEPTFINPQAFENVQEFTCTACGRSTIVEQLGDDEDMPNYCPNCGCKVVGE